MSIPVGGGPCAFDPEDIGGDRDTDLAVTACASGQIAILEFELSLDGPVPGVTVTTIDVGANPESVQWADLDGIGETDLVVGNLDDGTVSVILNEDGMSFEPPVTLPVGTEPRSIAEHLIWLGAS